MKKIALCLSMCLMICSLFSSCGNTDSKKDNGEISIVTTVFAQYDWTKQIVGENSGAQVGMLIDSSADMHSYEPTADDIIKISDCDMFIYIGGESDKWVEDALKTAVNKDMVVINLIDVLGENAKYSEAVEGMEHEHNEHEAHEEEYDEHIWLSLKNAEICCEYITQKLISLMPENESIFTENLNAYLNKLDALDNEYTQYFETVHTKKLLFADRFPFRYLVDDYSIGYYAAFSGCSSESQASFETIAFLSEKIKNENITEVFTIENSDCNIAQTVISATELENIEIFTLDSMQSSANEYISQQKTYLSVMENNLEVLKSALG